MITKLECQRLHSWLLELCSIIHPLCYTRVDSYARGIVMLHPELWAWCHSLATHEATYNIFVRCLPSEYQTVSLKHASAAQHAGAITWTWSYSFRLSGHGVKYATKYPAHVITENSEQCECFRMLSRTFHIHNLSLYRDLAKTPGKWHERQNTTQYGCLLHVHSHSLHVWDDI